MFGSTRYSRAGAVDRVPLAGWLALAGIVVAAFYLRGHDPLYNTAFQDERIYISYGEMFLSNHYEYPYEQPLRWALGWYLWPILATLAHRAGGLLLLRLFSAAIGTLTVLAVFGFARRLFTWQTGLAAAAIFAVMSPPIWAFRIATYDSGAIFFLAVGLWLYAKAWDEERDGVWLAAAGALFAGFLSKYMVALYFPVLVLLTLRKDWRTVALFAGSLTLACAAYGLYYWNDLAALVRFYGVMDAQAAPVSWLDVYGLRRADLWALVVLALFSARSRPTAGRAVVPLLWLGVIILLAFQATSGFLGPRFYKQASYALLFLVPLASAGLLEILELTGPTLYPAAATVGVVLTAAGVGWADRSWDTPRHVFWPNVDPVLAFFEGRVAPETRFLLDDRVLRYYLPELQPALPPRNVEDAYYLRYRDLEGPAAYAAAVRDGSFDYIVLDGSGMEPPVLAMREAIRPELTGRYVLRVRTKEPALLRTVEIYERVAPPVSRPDAAEGKPRVEIRSPRSGSPVPTVGIQAQVEGRVSGAPSGSFLKAELFTDRWYPQGDRFLPDATGAFAHAVYLGGQGPQQCAHVLRVRLYDSSGRWLAAASELGIVRANPDGSEPSCQ
jgi:hypothetical protein